MKNQDFIKPEKPIQHFEQGIEMYPVKIGEFTKGHIYGREPGNEQTRIEDIRQLHLDLGASAVIPSMNGHNSAEANRHNSEVTRVRFDPKTPMTYRELTDDYITSVVAMYPVRRKSLFKR
jgi:hypothetical protein